MIDSDEVTVERPAVSKRLSTERMLQKYFSGELKESESQRSAADSFGEFLVERAAISRFQLFRALQMQDRMPGARIGECVTALGYMRAWDLKEWLQKWSDRSA